MTNRTQKNRRKATNIHSRLKLIRKNSENAPAARDLCCPPRSRPGVGSTDSSMSWVPPSPVAGCTAPIGDSQSCTRCLAGWFTGQVSTCRVQHRTLSDTDLMLSSHVMQGLDESQLREVSKRLFTAARLLTDTSADDSLPGTLNTASMTRIANTVMHLIRKWPVSWSERAQYWMWHWSTRQLPPYCTARTGVVRV